MTTIITPQLSRPTFHLSLPIWVVIPHILGTAFNMYGEQTPDTISSGNYFWTNVEVSCQCKRPDIYQNMIACESCDRWMYMECVGLSNVPTAILGSGFV